jgi:hypothetical protein
MANKLSLRERRYKALLAKIARLTRERNKAIKTLVRAENALPRLERAARRMEFPTVRAKAAAAPPAPPSAPIASDEVPDLPSFLDRRLTGDERDELARREILAEQEGRKRNKARSRIEKLKAKKDGSARRMPLTGKAALEAIANG